MKLQAYQYNEIADLDAQILYLLARGVPICERPYLRLAQSLALGEMALILRIQVLIKEQRIKRSFLRTIDKRPPATHFANSSKILSHWDSQLLRLLKKGLPLSSRPFHVLAKQTDLPIDEVLFRIQRLHHQGYLEKVSPLL